MSTEQPNRFSKTTSDNSGTKTVVIPEINCDMGEGCANDAQLMPYIHAANIACGYHAGDETTMWETVKLALQYKVSIGAHVSFLDRGNFGRSEIRLPPEEVYELVLQQLIILQEIVTSFDTSIGHVKPHGALYNMSALDRSLAAAIARGVKDFDHQLVLYGLSGSHSIEEAKKIGLATRQEVFADRSYQDDGRLTSRQLPGALITDPEKAWQQVMQMVTGGTVTTVSGRIIPVVAETICVHGDGEQALPILQRIHEGLNQSVHT